MVKNSFHVLS